jgi:tetratricopeptide (TPR) repeat protein
MALSYRGQVLALRGRLDEAKQLEVEFLPRAREIGDAQILFPALAIGAQIDLALGDEAATLELVEEFDHVRRRSPHFGTLQMHLVARVCNGLKAVELGRRLLEGCSPIATRHRCCLLTAEATLAEAEERFDQGVERYTEAAERWREFGHVFEHGLALLGTGRCLLSLGRAGEARSAFSSAKEIFARLGAQPLVAESDALLERTAALTP